MPRGGDSVPEKLTPAQQAAAQQRKQEKREAAAAKDKYGGNLKGGPAGAHKGKKKK